MNRIIAVLLTLAGVGVGMMVISFSMDAAVSSVVSDCRQLGGFRHEGKVYHCTTIRSNGIQSPTHEVPLQPEFSEGGQEAEQPREGESSGRAVPRGGAERSRPSIENAGSSVGALSRSEWVASKRPL